MPGAYIGDGLRRQGRATVLPGERAPDRHIWSEVAKLRAVELLEPAHQRGTHRPRQLIARMLLG